ncbi:MULTISPECIES: class I SAM-dependent methyltransferase [unclassified Brucella]|uniref:class I SAM-dependent methyltransferase n=1 Tax=unclassified Brucella TaxID=2632610 RepID=UPI000972A552|nr:MULTISPECIES: class I SAM-dependent methyltransferase [unclassified Brucella]APX69823.1 methyltransferase [Brucella sp. 09RB8471]MRN42300.1 methyltransferase [Brucella sp. 09RB8913]MRN58177.1 methyltransferase [Brucella sp. 09RB8918]MRN78428.1 methyltransferase [Brucella sp. 10RB9210]CAB4326040.1 methyltransferase small [Brucella sp. 191011898]
MTTPAQKTLFLPFEQGILDMPDRGQSFLACGLAADRLLEPEWKQALTCLQPWRPDWLALQKEGFHAEPRLATDGNFSGGLLLLGKHRGRNEAWFAQLLARVQPGGWIVVSGDKKLGIDSFRKWAGNIAEISDRMSKNHAVVFWLRRPDDLDEAFIADLKPLAADIEGGFRTEPGMFSHGAIDKGSALLARHMEKIVFGNVADLGAGWGYLAAQCLKYADRIKNIDLYEADYEALEAARGNLERLGASIPISFNWFDVTSEKIAGIYDTVIMNPPFHEGRVTDVSLGQSFIAAAASRLKPGGRLLVVANRQLPYELTLKGLFKTVTLLEEAEGFKIFDAKK